MALTENGQELADRIVNASTTMVETLNERILTPFEDGNINESLLSEDLAERFENLQNELDQVVIDTQIIFIDENGEEVVEVDVIVD